MEQSAEMMIKPYQPLIEAIDGRLQSLPRVILAIDGDCGSGKSTLAAFLKDHYACPVFHMDDFFLRPEQRTPARFAEPGGNVDRERFMDTVLVPLTEGKTICYRPFDCGTMALKETAREIRPGRINIIEGSYSLHPCLTQAYTLRVFLALSGEEQRRRILAREGEERAVRFFERWIPFEKAYQQALRPQEAADLYYCDNRLIR